MTDRHRGSLSLADIMILVVGAALSFASWRYIASMRVWSGFPDSLQRYYFKALGGVAFLAPLSLTVLAIALRRDGRRLREVASQPAGIVGISTGVVLLTHTTIHLALSALVSRPPSSFADGKVLYYCRLLAEQTGMAIAAVCVVQFVAGSWRKPAGAVDWLACLLGLCWILLAIGSAAFTLV